jgi:hypothetical protein
LAFTRCISLIVHTTGARAAQPGRAAQTWRPAQTWRARRAGLCRVAPGISDARPWPFVERLDKRGHLCGDGCDTAIT